MLFVGIDVAKNKHDCCIIDSDGVVHNDSLRIENSTSGSDSLVEAIYSSLYSKDISTVT